MQHSSNRIKSDWIFLSKGGQDKYINMFAQGSNGVVTNTDDFNYDDSTSPIVLRGILKHKIMKKCLKHQRDFYYMDSGYFGNTPSDLNPGGWKIWHRIVLNDLQHNMLTPRPDDRLKPFNLTIPKRRTGSKIIIAAPDEKPCRFYNIDRNEWLTTTINQVKQYTDRPIIVRERASSRRERVHNAPLSDVLKDDIHALVTFNSNAATESILNGVPAFVLAPSHAASPVSNIDINRIDNPFWPEAELIYAWLCHLSYGQFHVSELRNGTAYKILQENT